MQPMACSLSLVSLAGADVLLILLLILSFSLAAGQGWTGIALVCADVSVAVLLTTPFLVSVIFWGYMRLNLLLGSARGCPGNTWMTPVWLDRCNPSPFLSFYVSLAIWVDLQLNNVQHPSLYWCRCD